MTPSTMKFLPITIALTLPAFAGSSKDAVPSSGDWQWSVSAGPSIRKLGTLKTNSGYRSASVAVPSFVGGESLTVPPIGDEAGYGERFYDDGYVRQDAGTPADGTTWYWGYDNAAQVQGDQLVFSATGAQSLLRDAYAIPALGPSTRDSLRGFAPHIQLDVLSPYQVAGFRIGFSGGLDFTQADHASTFSNYSGSQFRDDYRLDYEDRYDLQGVIPPLAPYAGSLAGPGPLINNIPSSRSVTPVLLFTDTANLSNQVWNSLDIDAFSLALGPTLSRSWGPFEFSFQGGVILNIYNWEARQAERLTAVNASGPTTVAQWAEGDSGTKFRPGLYAQGQVNYDVGNHYELAAFLRLETASEFRAQAGPSIYRIDPTGFTSGLMLRYWFP